MGAPSFEKSQRAERGLSVRASTGLCSRVTQVAANVSSPRQLRNPGSSLQAGRCPRVAVGVRPKIKRQRADLAFGNLAHTRIHYDGAFLVRLHGFRIKFDLSAHNLPELLGHLHGLKATVKVNRGLDIPVPKVSMMSNGRTRAMNDATEPCRSSSTCPLAELVAPPTIRHNAAVRYNNRGVPVLTQLLLASANAAPSEEQPAAGRGRDETVAGLQASSLKCCGKTGCKNAYSRENDCTVLRWVIPRFFFAGGQQTMCARRWVSMGRP